MNFIPLPMESIQRHVQTEKYIQPKTAEMCNIVIHNSVCARVKKKITQLNRFRKTCPISTTGSRRFNFNLNMTAKNGF